MSIVVAAVYQQGTLKPLSTVALVENERVDLMITRHREKPQETRQPRVASLRGIWKHLPLPSEDEVATAIRQFRAGTQSRTDKLAQELAAALHEGQ